MDERKHTSAAARLGRYLLDQQLIADQSERNDAVRSVGVYFVACGIGLLGLLQLPKHGGWHPGLAYGLAGFALAVGAMIMSWKRWWGAPPIIQAITQVVGIGLIALGIWATGGVHSDAWPCLVGISICSCAFYRASWALFFLAECVLALAAPFAYAPSAAANSHVPAELLVTVTADLAIGATLFFVRRVQVDRRRQAEQEAQSDPLTGLANHRELDRRLRADVAKARETSDSLAVAVLDVDHFKQINDVVGHDEGDASLVHIADSLRAAAKSGDLVARSGGDEFTWVMAGTRADEAKRRAATLQQAVREAPWSPQVTISVGIADNSWTHDPAELTRLADGALYWSKARGRNRCSVYDPEVVEALSAEERAERLERSQAMRGLRALARAIDAKDPETRMHSERVSELARELAVAAGWKESRADLLAEAALVHDVGKIGIDDRILRKDCELTPEDREHVETHAELSARIVAGVLSAEQVSWIQTHHERADGTGYPRALTAAEIPAGGALLAVADAYDAMTAGRAYSDQREVDDVLAEITSLANLQFTSEAVAALQVLVATKETDTEAVSAS
ncbi:MAG: diguanylate cyclase [Solirubrobacterales bacterium]|nr:diguanylate cyclase [Solirubrobacterales bacterium]